MENFRKFSEKVNLFFKKVFSIILPQGNGLIFTIVMQCSFIILFWFWLTVVIHEPNRYWYFSPGIFLLGILGAMLAGVIAAALAKAFQFIPFFFLAAIAFALVIAAYTTSSIASNWQTVLAINLWLALPPILIGFGISYIQKQDKGKLVYRIIGWLFLACGSFSVILGILWIYLPGFSNQNPMPQIVDSRRDVPLLDLQNPAATGSYPVLSLTYGSGTDKVRTKFAENANLVTQSVDGSSFLPSLEKFPGWLYKLQWGFDKSELPLNGRVWYPQGDGPFPLVLIVHGNHTALDFSDQGYAYLGELLASRGMIVVSVDENFLNSSWINAISDDYSHQENDARGWLLLKHLQQFRKWDKDSNNPFFQLVDWKNIALIGHSRGGEAISEAAFFNAIGAYPDNGNIKFPDKFNIKTLIAIAPVDGQYNPAARETPIENINYLVIHGSADADLKNYPGQAAYSRVSFTDPMGYYVKSSVYVHRANHGQFNTTWGEADNGKLSYYLLNRQLLIDNTAQQQTAQVLISAFLELTLNSEFGYKGVFEDPRTAKHWLPDITLWSQYSDSTATNLSNFEEDTDIQTGSYENSRISARHMDLWRETILYGNRNRAIGSSVVNLSWNNAEGPYAEYEIKFENPVMFTQAASISFAAAVQHTNENGEIVEPVNFTLQLSDGTNRAEVQLADYALLYENPILSLSKAKFMNRIYSADVVLQTVQIPLIDLQSKEHPLNLTSITSVTFIFDQTDQGKIWIDDIAIR